MPQYANADRIVVRGFWKDEDGGTGVPGATVTFDPVPLTQGTTGTPNLRDLTAYGHLKLRSKVATVDPDTGYYAAIVVSNNDPDLDAYLGRRVTFSGEAPFTIAIPYNAPSTTVDAAMAAAIPELTVGQSVKAIWLVEASLVDGTPPPPLASYMTSTQTLSAIATAVGTVRQVPSGGTSGQVVTKNSDSTYGWATPASGGGGGGSTPDATASTKGQSVILGGTADAPTVPYGKVTGAPSSLPPSGGAGGVLGGTYPNPSFAVDMATQAELDAAVAAVPEQARDAVGAALVAGTGISVTVNDAADTITITATGGGGGSYTDEQAQDAMAALLSAGTQSGITFTYDDAGNALSATVPANSAAGTPSLRALGTGATQAAPGNDSRLSDARPWTLYGGGSPSSGQVPAWNGTSYVPTTVTSGGAVADATTTTKGIIQLAGDFGGTAAAPTVPGKAPLFAQRSTTTAAATTAADNEIVPLDTTNGGFALTGPTSGAPFGARWRTGAVAPTIAAPSGFTINGQPSITMNLAPSGTTGELVTWQAFGTDYQPINSFKGQSQLDSQFLANAATPLKRFRQALAAADTASLNWWAYGDSVSESYGATVLSNGYAFQILKALQKRALGAGRGGVGYLSTYWTIFAGTALGPDASWTFSGGGTNSTSGGIFSGRRRVFASGETATLAFTGTAAIIHYRQGDATCLPFTVAVDGGTAATITPSTTGGLNARGTYTTGFLARSAHSIVIAPSSGNALPIVGAGIYDGDQINNGGLRLYDGAQSGARSGGFATNAEQGSAAAALDQAAVAPNPALVTICLGVNDQNDNVPPSTVAANITQIIANVKAACTITPSFLVIAPYGRGDLSSPTYSIAQYAAAIKTVAANDPTNVAVLDLTEHFIDLPTAANLYNRGLINSDGVHPTDAGHRFMAQLILRRLLGPIELLERGMAPTVYVDEIVRPVVNVQAAAYTLALTDANRAVEYNSSTAGNITVPANSSVAFPVGTIIEVAQLGSGQATLVAASGVTLRTASTLITRTQNSVVALRKRGTDDWVVSGDTT